MTTNIYFFHVKCKKKNGIADGKLLQLLYDRYSDVVSYVSNEM